MWMVTLRVADVDVGGGVDVDVYIHIYSSLCAQQILLVASKKGPEQANTRVAAGRKCNPSINHTFLAVVVQSPSYSLERAVCTSIYLSQIARHSTTLHPQSRSISISTS